MDPLAANHQASASSAHTSQTIGAAPLYSGIQIKITDPDGVEAPYIESSYIENPNIESPSIQNRKIKKSVVPPDIREFQSLRDDIEIAANTFPQASELANRPLFEELIDSMKHSLKYYEKQKIPNIATDDSLPEKIFPTEEDRWLKEFMSTLTNQLFSIRIKRTYANLDRRFIRKLSEYLQNSPCLEVFAGNGWLTEELVKAGVNITATDDFSWFETNKLNKSFIRNVQQKSAFEAAVEFLKATENEPRATILISFPIHDDPSTKLEKIFQFLLEHRPNLRIINIDANLPAWQAPQNASATDLTERLNYTPSSIVGERVMEYRSDPSKAWYL